ncbi:hypothetical protein R3P38DRAFT_3366840 [Favolaschia claudopus]|uniref:Uncharacterized protein n=1 Tax=Favolaschia claudopus TaxID=2862362 RepID=A0AAW0AA33_9AGAR
MSLFVFVVFCVPLVTVNDKIQKHTLKTARVCDTRVVVWPASKIIISHNMNFPSLLFYSHGLFLPLSLGSARVFNTPGFVLPSPHPSPTNQQQTGLIQSAADTTTRYVPSPLSIVPPQRGVRPTPHPTTTTQTRRERGAALRVSRVKTQSSQRRSGASPPSLSAICLSDSSAGSAPPHRRLHQVSQPRNPPNPPFHLKTPPPHTLLTSPSPPASSDTSASDSRPTNSFHPHQLHSHLHSLLGSQLPTPHLPDAAPRLAKPTPAPTYLTNQTISSTPSTSTRCLRRSRSGATSLTPTAAPSFPRHPQPQHRFHAPFDAALHDSIKTKPVDNDVSALHGPTPSKIRSRIKIKYNNVPSTRISNPQRPPARQSPPLPPPPPSSGTGRRHQRRRRRFGDTLEIKFRLTRRRLGSIRAREAREGKEEVNAHTSAIAAGSGWDGGMERRSGSRNESETKSVG